MRTLVAKIKTTPFVYKYLTYGSGIKMLEACNIQFTRASKLNDCLDCCAEKIDYSNFRSQTLSFLDSQRVKDIALKKDRQVISNYGICSLGTSADNNILWERYTPTGQVKNGICIELDTNEILTYLKSSKVCALYVSYFDNIKSSIPRNLLISDNNMFRLLFMHHIIATKNKVDPIRGFNWEVEKELRFIWLSELQEDYFRVPILPIFVKKVWCDKDISLKEFEDLNKLVKKKYQIDIIRR